MGEGQDTNCSVHDQYLLNISDSSLSMSGAKDASQEHDVATFERQQANNHMVAAGLKALTPRYKVVFAKVMPGVWIGQIVTELKNISGDLLETKKNPLFEPFIVVIHAACTARKRQLRREDGFPCTCSKGQTNQQTIRVRSCHIEKDPAQERAAELRCLAH